jgi:type II secretory pathway component PulF
LSERHAELRAAKLKLILACAYPLGVLHLGLLLLPLVRLIDWEKGFQWSAIGYARGVAMGIVPLWGAALVLWILARRGSPALAAVMRAIPVVGRYVRAQALADFSFALANFLEAGVPIGEAWSAAGLVTSSPQLKTAASAITALIKTGAAPGAKLSAWPCFPADFVALYHTGEQTGQLDANLHRLAAQYQEAANRALTLATLIYPTLLFLIVAGGVVYFVVSLYSGYLKMLTKLAS